MADGPTSNQIINKRTSDINACEANASVDRAKIENSYTLNLPLREFVMGLILRGPSGLKAMLMGPVESAERVCKYKALMNADVAFATREAEQMVETARLKGIAEGRTLELAGSDTAIGIYRDALRKEHTRAVVAETVATQCLIQIAPNAPAPQRRSSGQLVAAKR